MKIVLIKTEGIAPHAIHNRHLDKIRVVSRKLEVVGISCLDKNQIEKHVANADIIAGVPNVIPSIAKAKNIKWIHSFSAGMDKVLTPEIIKSKIIVSNSSGIHAVPIAEHVMGIMLMLVRKFHDSFRNQQRKIWSKNQNITELHGRTILIVGLGKIGTEIARLASCFNTNVIAIKQNVKDKPNFINKVYSIDRLEEILPKADFVVLCLPLTSKTYHLFNMQKFKLMKKSGVLINIGRGKLIDEEELIRALDKKIIAGAGLDVTEDEPLSKESKLWEMENVIITPHHSGWSEKYMDRAIDLFCLNLKAYLAHKPLPNLVDKKRGY